jgi:hypothetical protein
MRYDHSGFKEILYIFKYLIRSHFTVLLMPSKTLFITLIKHAPVCHLNYKFAYASSCCIIYFWSALASGKVDAK